MMDLLNEVQERTCVCGHSEFKGHPSSFSVGEDGRCVGMIGSERCTCLGFRIRRGRKSREARVASTSPPRCRQAVRSPDGIVYICNTRLSGIDGSCNGAKFHITGGD